MGQRKLRRVNCEAATDTKHIEDLWKRAAKTKWAVLTQCKCDQVRPYASYVAGDHKPKSSKSWIYWLTNVTDLFVSISDDTRMVVHKVSSYHSVTFDAEKEEMTRMWETLVVNLRIGPNKLASSYQRCNFSLHADKPIKVLTNFVVLLTRRPKLNFIYIILIRRLSLVLQNIREPIEWIRRISVSSIEPWLTNAEPWLSISFHFLFTNLWNWSAEIIGVGAKFKILLSAHFVPADSSIYYNCSY